MLKSRNIAIFVAGFTSMLALFLVINRGGLIAWSALLVGCALLAKTRLKPSRLDLHLSVWLTTLSVAAWVGTHYYVISRWESGEVVELTIETSEGAHTARLWVLDLAADPLVYYEAEPEIAEHLLAGRPVQLNRAGEVSSRIPKTTLVDALAEDEANRILGAMQAKYGDLNHAAVVRFVLLGGWRDRVAVVANLVEE